MCAGAGKPMCARFDEVGFSIQRFNGCERAWDDYGYHDRNSELWDTASKAVKDGEVILPWDEKLIAQLCSRKRGKPDSRGRQRAESKLEILKRDLPSPDRADAVVGVISILGSGKVQQQPKEIVPSWLDRENEYGEFEGDEEAIIGRMLGYEMNGEDELGNIADNEKRTFTLEIKDAEHRAVMRIQQEEIIAGNASLSLPRSRHYAI